ncbi:MAG: phosphomannomutase/phosphoglucomutase [Patescibacteria group bacterium]|jgi:phosphomannomutase
MNPSIFKAYDIRGVYPEEVNENTAHKIGLAFAKYAKAKNIMVGEDARVSSPALRDALVRGLTDSGVNVVLAGVCTTPLFYFSVASTKNIDAGIMITASHNPGKYNGFKMVWGDASPIEPSAIQKITNNELRITNNKKNGIIKNINVADAYVQKLLTLVSAKKIPPVKIVIDAGNGTAGITAEKLLAKLPQLKSKNIFFEIDMSFPNHEANPIKPENMTALRAEVISAQADFGAAYDGDADRIGFVDEKGQQVGADLIYAAILPQIISRKTKSTALYDLRCSKIVPETITALGGTPRMTRVGHAFIKKDIAKYHAVAAAELSAHYYFQKFYGADCADLTLLYLLAEINRQKKPLSQIIAPFKKYFQSGEINFEVKNKDAAIAAILKKYKKSATKFTDIDGIRLEFKDGADFWWLSVRASNTEPLLRLNMEASNQKLLNEKLQELQKMLENMI